MLCMGLLLINREREMTMRVFLVGTKNMEAGGLEVLHQFSKCLTDNKIDNFMIYLGDDGINCPTPKAYLKYGVKYVTSYIDAEDSILVLAETQLSGLDLCRKGKIMVWWLSVENYLFSRHRQIIAVNNNIDTYNFKGRSNVIHFAQSYYAKILFRRYWASGNATI